MLAAISLSIYEHRQYLVLSLVISMIAIPIADILVVQRDRNRNEMYGEAFWIYGFTVYNMNDTELVHNLDTQYGFNFNESLYTLPDYLGGVHYEYPVFGLIFFAIATWLFPGSGAGSLQPLWLNFLLVLVFNLNLVLLTILLGDKMRTMKWARYFFGAYFAYGLTMAAAGGKLEPIVDCLLLMALVLWKENQHGKSMFTLGLSVQTKIYPLVAFPVLFLGDPLSSVWFLASMFVTVFPVFFGANFESLFAHLTNEASYSTFIVNPIWPGLALGTPNMYGSADPSLTYLWPPALIPAIIYAVFVLLTFRNYLPNRTELAGKSIHEKLVSLIPVYLYLIPSLLLVFRWIMPWYLYWFAPVIVLFKDDSRALGYLRQTALVGLLYLLGIIVNWPYFIAGPLPAFMEHFPVSAAETIGGLILLVISICIAYFAWKLEIERRERKAITVREAEARGELII
jgi:uncharacterized membrane protein